MIFRVAVATGLLLAANGALAAPAKPKPPSTVVITNARAVATTEVAIGVGEQSVRLSKPLASKAKTALKLPKMSGCVVAVAASFEDESTADLGEFDVCKDSTIRFTD
jgi:hypothetical protein